MAEVHVESSLKIPVTSANDGSRLLLGDASDHAPGTMALCIVNAADMGGAPFVGSLTLLGRIRGGASSADGVPWLPLPFRQFFLNGAPADGSMVPNQVVSGTSLIAVPLTGFALAIDVACASGSATIYKSVLTGAATP